MEQIQIFEEGRKFFFFFLKKREFNGLLTSFFFSLFLAKEEIFP
jgi:hypothetical protein